MRGFLLLCLFSCVIAGPCPFGPRGSCLPLEGRNETSNSTNLAETIESSKNETKDKEPDVKWVGTWIPIEGVVGFPTDPDGNQDREESDDLHPKRFPWTW